MWHSCSLGSISAAIATAGCSSPAASSRTPASTTAASRLCRPSPSSVAAHPSTSTPADRFLRLGAPVRVSGNWKLTQSGSRSIFFPVADRRRGCSTTAENRQAEPVAWYSAAGRGSAATTRAAASQPTAGSPYHATRATAAWASPRFPWAAASPVRSSWSEATTWAAWTPSVSGAAAGLPQPGGTASAAGARLCLGQAARPSTAAWPSARQAAAACRRIASCHGAD